MEVKEIMDDKNCLAYPQSCSPKRQKGKRKSNNLETLEKRALEYFLSEWEIDRAKPKKKDNGTCLSEKYTENDLRRWVATVIRDGRIKWDEIAEFVINQKMNSVLLALTLDFLTDVGILYTETLDNKVFGVFDKMRGSKSSSCLYLVKEKETIRYYFKEKYDALAYMWGINIRTKKSVALFLQASQKDGTFAPENQIILTQGVWGYDWNGNLQKRRR